MNWWMWIIASLYFFLPGGLANCAPVLTRKFRCLAFLGKPVDGGKMWKGKPLFGKNKTWRGLIMGAVFGVVVGLIQYAVQDSVSWLQLFEYSLVDGVVIGFLLGLGALLGDLGESFVKRRLNRAPGAPFVPFDQIDLVVGGLILVSIYIILPWQVWVSLLIIMVPVHFLFNLLGYGLKLQKEWW